MKTAFGLFVVTTAHVWAQDPVTAAWNFETTLPGLQWSIESDTPPFVAEFSDSSTNEIVFNFLKTKGRDHQFALYETSENADGEFSCGESAVVLSDTSPVDNPSSTTAGGVTSFSVDVDVDVSTIASKDVYTVSDDGNTAYITFCARVDLVLESLSVSFIEVPIEIQVDLTKGFEVSSVALQRIGATVVTESADVEYELEACQCDIDTITTDTRCTGGITTGVYTDGLAMSQNSVLEVCISTVSDDVEIVEIQSLRIQQLEGEGATDEFIYAIGTGSLTEANNDGTVSALTAYDSSTPGHIQSVATRLVSAFFPNQADIPGIKVTGQALLQFDSGRRRLASITVGRSLQESNTESPFELNVQLVNEQDETSSSIDEVSSAHQIGAAIGFAVATIYSLL